MGKLKYIFIHGSALKKDTSVRDVLYGFNAPDLFRLLFPLMREFPICLFLYGKFICIFIIIRGIKILPPFIFVRYMPAVYAASCVIHDMHYQPMDITVPFGNCFLQLLSGQMDVTVEKRLLAVTAFCIACPFHGKTFAVTPYQDTFINKVTYRIIDLSCQLDIVFPQYAQ